MVRRTGTRTSVWLLFLTTALALSALSDATTAERLSFSFNLPRENVTLAETQGVSRVDVRGEGFDRLLDEGSPALPYRIVNVLLPQGHEVGSYTFTDVREAVLLENANIEKAPAWVAEDQTVGRGDGMARASALAYPDQPGRYLGTGYLHGRAIASFALFPLRLVDGTLRLSEEMTLEVETRPLSAPVDVTVRERFREGFEGDVRKILSTFVVNPEMNDRYNFPQVRVDKKKGGFQPTSYPSLEGSPVDYVIITTPELAGVYQRLADWKSMKGVPTVIRTTDWIVANTKNGVDLAETVRFFIRDAYAKWGVTYVLLGGDTDVLPTRYGYSRFYQNGTEVPTDLYFGCLDGTWNDTHDDRWGEGTWGGVPYDDPDVFAEVYYGRIPMSDAAAVDQMIDKIINYETPVNTSFQDRMMFLAEVLFPVNWKFGDPISLNGADFAEFLIATAMVGHPMDLTRMYETAYLYTGSVQESKAAAIDSLNAGYNLVNQIGHGYRFNMSVGDASILNADADAMTNDNRFFNLYMLNCTAAAYDYYCLAEHFLRNQTGGTVSAIGASESAFPNASANYMNEFYRLLFQDDVVNIGEVFGRSRLPRSPVAAGGDNVDLWTHYIYAILADPEMPLYTGPISALSVFHAPSVGLGANSILINVTSGGPVEGALVCLSKGNDDYEVGLTNSLGNVVLDFTAESAGTIDVVVTAINRVRSHTTITVTGSASAYVNYADLTVDDDQAGGTFGNGDGVIDAGETVDLTLQLKNSGGAPSGNVSLVLRCTNPSVTLLDTTAVVGAIASGATKSALDPVRVELSSSMPDETAVEFILKITDPSPAQWNDRFRKEIHAPQLELIQLRVDDGAPLGNGNGVVDAGEQFLLYYELKNYGTGAANQLTGVLQDLDGAFTFFDSSDTYPTLGPMAEDENTSGFHILETSVAVEHDLRIAVTDLFSRVYVDTFELRRPLPPDSLKFDASLGVDRLETSWKGSPSTDVVRYNVYHSLTPGGPYQQVNTDPVDHRVFLDAGLMPNTRYYYVATAVDASGNESAESPEYSASTNPPQMPGFPIQLAFQTTSDPAVGDIDGDGDKEIVVGNEFIYAWHHDGIELRDGDEDPQSWGVLNTEGDEFDAGVALGVIDAVPGLDIVAGDLMTKKIYVMNYNGDVLPGWPRQCENGFRAAPAIGDLDGDGLNEVVAVDVRGVIYAWHRDGVEVRDGDSNPATQGVFFRTPLTASHYQSPTLCDIDNDGKDEIVLGTRTLKIYVLNEDGTSPPGWPYSLPGEASGSVVAGDIDDDGMLELVCHTKTSQVYLLNHDATVAAGWPRFISINQPFFTPSPALADFDGDGKLEIVLVGYTSLATKLYVIKSNAQDWTGWPLTFQVAIATECSPTVADINGDNVLDIVIGDESRFLYAWDINKNPVAGFPIGVGDAIRAAPFLDDVDQDGDVDMIVHCWDTSMYVFDLMGTYNSSKAPWPALQGNSHRNGCYGFVVPSGIGGGAVFTYDVVLEGVNLRWWMPNADVYRFDLERASVDANGDASPFTRLAADVTADAAGVLTYLDSSVEMGGTYVYRLVSRDDPSDVLTSGQIYVPVSRADLLQNHPNPFNPSTEIVYYVPEGGNRRVSLVIYDVTGARVRTLVDELRATGRHVVAWDGRDDRGNPVGSGVYFYRMQQRGFSASKKMVFLK